METFVLMTISAVSLPLLSVLALLLRRDLFKGISKILFLCVGFVLLFIAVLDTIQEHAGTVGIKDVLIGTMTACITLFMLSKYGHTHIHAKEQAGVKGIVISEAFHSLIDGAVIGSTYLISPLLGYAATIGIIIHEFPKIIGTLTLFRSFGLSIRKTIWYGICAQIGSPVSALLIYLIGGKISHENFQALEIASISSLAAIVLWILYLEIRFHQKHDHHKH